MGDGVDIDTGYVGDLPLGDFDAGGAAGSGFRIDPAGFKLDGSEGGGGWRGGSSLYDFSKQLDLPGGGSGGGGGWWDKLLSGASKEFTDSPLSSFAKALGIGTTGLSFMNSLKLGGQVNEQTKNIRQSQADARAAAAPAVAAGTADVQRAQAGKLQPAMEASIQEWEQKAIADVQGRYASMGLGNSADIQGEINKIKLAGQSMRAQLLQGEEALGYQGLQTGVSAATGGGQIAQNQQKLLMDLIASANQQFGLLGGRA